MSSEAPELVCLFCGRTCRRWWHVRPVDHPVVVGQPLTAEERTDGLYAHTGGTGELVLEVRAGRGGARGRIEVWTGSFFYYGSKDAPFCRLKCAEHYAVQAARCLARMGQRLVFRREVDPT